MADQTRREWSLRLYQELRENRLANLLRGKNVIIDIPGCVTAERQVVGTNYDRSTGWVTINLSAPLMRKGANSMVALPIAHVIVAFDKDYLLVADTEMVHGTSGHIELRGLIVIVD